ncbi:MAG: hypothetical protein ACLROW_00095 [Roseburia faecis]|jgi:hypothetical protein
MKNISVIEPFGIVIYAFCLVMLIVSYFNRIRQDTLYRILTMMFSVGGIIGFVLMIIGIIYPLMFK